MHKTSEIRAILAPLLPAGCELISLGDLGIPNPPDEIERYETFEENALAKAVWCRDRSGLASLADDSGLCVDALGGMPGVRSARWAGPSDADRIERLLRELRSVGATDRSARAARFVCAAVFAPAEARSHPLAATGSLEGWIADTPRGNGGFGYDPVFLIERTGSTLAEAGVDLKNQISHRAAALKNLAPQICLDV